MKSIEFSLTEVNNNNNNNPPNHQNPQESQVNEDNCRSQIFLHDKRYFLEEHSKVKKGAYEKH